MQWPGGCHQTMTYSLSLEQDELGISQEIDLFIKHIDSIGHVLPGMVIAVQGMTKSTFEELKKFEDLHCKIEEAESERTVAVPYLKLNRWKKLARKHEDFALASKLLPRSLIVSLVSQYDAYLGRLLRALFIGKPEILNNSERKLSFEDIAGLASIDNARDLILEKEVESILRSSHADQFKWMENAFKLPLTKDLKCWPAFIELTERRNLFVHTDGIISSQYLSACTKHGCKIDASLDEGITLWVSAEYFHEAHECIFEIGTKLGHVLWRKLFPSDRERADKNLNDLTYDLIDQGRYNLAICLLDFAFEEIKKYSNEASKLSFLINRAQAYKWNGDERQCKEILDQIDWSAKSDNFQLANAVLTDRFSDAQAIMERIGKSGSISSNCYRDWPLFKRFRESEEFLTAYKAVFDEEFATSAEAVAIEPLADEASGIIESDDNEYRVEHVPPSAIQDAGD